MKYSSLKPMSFFGLVALFLLGGFPAFSFEPNYDEEKVGTFELPNPLVCEDGTEVTTPELWMTKRRPELLRLFQSEMYGFMPPASCAHLRAELLSEKTVMDGKAIRREVRLYLNDPEPNPKMDLLIYLPTRADGPVPAFFGPNFMGNHAVTNDPTVRLPEFDPDYQLRFSVPAERGAKASRWEIEKVIDRGYALITVYYEDIDPDYDDGRQNGVHPLFRAWEEEAKIPEASRPATITAWAWGLSRGLDYLETVPEIDAQKVVVMGHSRLGKTALWTAANDTRFAAAISNDSGCGGAALTRRNFGETAEFMSNVLSWWFCPKYFTYLDDLNALPFDQHELIALVAPRPVYIASASEDLWADPKGEFLSALNAEPVYLLLGTDGLLGTNQQPGLDTPVGGTIHYHLRTGVHDVKEFDWVQYLDFADRYVK